MATDPTNERGEGEAADGVLRRRRKDEDTPGEGPAEVEAGTAGELVEVAPATNGSGAAAAVEAAPATAAARPAPPRQEPPRRAGPPKTVDEDVDFGALLDADDAREQIIEQGMIVRGEIIAFNNDWAFVDLGAKTEGILPTEELRGDDGTFSHSVGDPIETFVVSTHGGEIRLSFALGRQIQDNSSLIDAYEAGIPVEGRVVSTNKGGFEVRIGGRRAFCPISQIDIGFTEDPTVHVGQTYTFRLKEVSENGKRVVVSRADYLRAQRKAAKRETLETLAVGEEIEGTVTSVQEYGAFVDLGGVEGLVHVSELTWQRVEHPSEVVKEGDAVTVKVLSIKETDKGERISLSMRETTPHPWVAVGTKFVEGESYSGSVTRLEPYGAFVEIGPGVEGLVHVSELSWTTRVNHPNELLTVGQPLQVYIKSIDEDRHRIGLSVKALERNPWSGAADRYPLGAQVEGTVEKVQPFGVFVEIEPGLTALIPASESNTGHGSDLRREFPAGLKVTATVLSVEPGRQRMSLSLKAAVELKDQAAVKDYFAEQTKAEQNSGGFGTLGDLFKQKLK